MIGLLIASCWYAMGAAGVLVGVLVTATLAFEVNDRCRR